MRFVYADPGLSDGIGHNATSCRLIVGELSRRGIDTRVLANQTIGADLSGRLGAAPYFRCHAFWQSDGDPVCGWLNAFHISAQITCEDLAKVTGLGPEDILYVNSAMPAQLMAVIHLMNRLAPKQRPRTVMEFATDPGIDFEPGPNGPSWKLREGQPGQRAVLFRFAVKHIRGDGLPNLHLATFDADSSAAFAALLDRPVDVLPVPREALLPLRRRARRLPATIGVLGHQRAEKGYHLMPEVAKILLQEHADIRLLVHNSAPAEMPKTQQALRDLAAADSRLVIDERIAGPEVWATLLESIDLVLCPYVRARFVTSYSSVVSEAIANGIPLVVPAKTSLSRVIAEQGGAGTTFDRFDPASIVEAVGRALARLDDFAAPALAGAEAWKIRHGAGAVVDAILALAGKEPVAAK